MSEELKPCPFCERLNEVPNVQYDYLLCAGCSAECHIDEWNTRPIEDALQDKLKQITAELELLEGWVEAGEPSRDKIRQWTARALQITKGEHE